MMTTFYPDADSAIERLQIERLRQMPPLDTLNPATIGEHRGGRPDLVMTLSGPTTESRS